MHIEASLKKLAGMAQPHSIDDYDFGGTWKNELGSTMTVGLSNGALTGIYSSPVSGSGSPVTGQISGFASQDIVAFVVKWNIATASMTTWVGQVERQGTADQIRTLWHLVRDIPDPNEPQSLWTSILTGTDLFRRP